MPEVAAGQPSPVAVLEQYRRAGRAWAVTPPGRPGEVAGFVLVDVVDGAAHVEQVSVDPAVARRGWGRRLLDHVAAVAAAEGRRAVTLSTFRDVPWNAPYYERCGFRVLGETELGPGLRARRAAEAAAGLDPALRVCMRRDLAPVHLLTVGHGTLSADGLAGLVAGAGVDLVVDVRSYPGSRRHPRFGREAMAVWLPEAGVAYGWERRLGGRRRPQPGGPNVALRHPAFRAYADHMATPEFAAALTEVLTDAAGRTVAVMCSETLWWRCHRRLLADAAVLGRGARVEHLGHDGRVAPHAVTAGARRDGDGDGDGVVYDVGSDRPLPL
ncbi:MAG TPA: GNAT family N-acetyltransferase [Acidimicrobiales bacterium]|nr:GNAT family N-acetyltransferase [Acidimicrobiales bacterium]